MELLRRNDTELNSTARGSGASAQTDLVTKADFDREASIKDKQNVKHTSQSPELPVPLKYSTPKKYIKRNGAVSATRQDLSVEEEPISDGEILQEQTLKPGEPQLEDTYSDETIRNTLSVSKTDLSGRDQLTEFITGIPDKDALESNKLAANATDALTSKRSRSTNFRSSTSSQRSYKEMGSNASKEQSSTRAKHIISEDPELMASRKRILESEVTGNCRPWSDHVFYKLFLDTDGRNATLMVLKCEISYVDVFTDEEHSLYKSRFIGGKKDGVSQVFAFDLMKSRWEEKIPQSQAIELNVDIVMSSSPIYQCSEILLNLLQLEKAYLKHRRFDGQLNVMIRFAHPHGWETKDEAFRERVFDGLRNLYREGANLEVMSADFILEEMRVDGILPNDEAVKHYLAKRQTWKQHAVKLNEFIFNLYVFNAYYQNIIKRFYPKRLSSTNSFQEPFFDYDIALVSHSKSSQEKNEKPQSPKADVNESVSQLATSLGKANTLATMIDSYYVLLHDELWNIIQDTQRVKDILEETTNGVTEH